MSLKKAPLTRRGYESFQDWDLDPNHLYIGRDMSHHVEGALGSKWGNPYKVAKNASKKAVDRCLERYEDYIRRTPRLFNALMELEGKEMGCWCKPYPCHGDVLIKLFKERQGSNPNFSRSSCLDYAPVITRCRSNGHNDDDGDDNDLVFDDTIHSSTTLVEELDASLLFQSVREPIETVPDL